MSAKIENPQAPPSPHEDDPYRPPEPDISELITDTDEPVDGLYSEREMRLLTGSLYASWNPGRPYVAYANVALYGSPTVPAVVPDVMVSLDAKVPADEESIHEKKNRSYLVWVHGKPPEIVIEIVSPTKGGELDRKLDIYANIRVSYYVVYDPVKPTLEERLKQFVLIGNEYEPYPVKEFKSLGLSLVEWTGEFEGWRTRWLRWADQSGKVLPTGEERAEAESQRAEVESQRAEAESQRAEAESQRAEAESQRAEAESQRADRLAAKLREMGVDPDSFG